CWCPTCTSWRDRLAFLLGRLIAHELEPGLELIERIEQGPPAMPRQQHDCVAHALDHDLVAVEAELLGQAYRLATAVGEELCGIHGEPPIRRYRWYISSRSIYLR